MSEKKRDPFQVFCQSKDIFEIAAAYAEMEAEIVRVREANKPKQNEDER